MFAIIDVLFVRKYKEKQSGKWKHSRAILNEVALKDARFALTCSSTFANIRETLHFPYHCLLYKSHHHALKYFFRFYSSLVNNLSHKYKDVHAAAAEVLGMALKYIAESRKVVVLMVTFFLVKKNCYGWPSPLFGSRLSFSRMLFLSRN